MLDILLFFLAGIAAGVFFGIVPGLHPNLVVLAVPLLAGIAPFHALAFIVAMAVANSIVDVIPSIALGAPDAGSELSVLPGHKLLLEGRGYEAIKLTVMGSVGAMLAVVLFMPGLVVFVPLLFGAAAPYTHYLLAGIAAFLILTEKGGKKLFAALAFFAAGIIGIYSASLPVRQEFLLFPILAGLFGMSALLLQMRTKSAVPTQTEKQDYISRRAMTKSILLGSAGGVAAGMLPGVGTSQVASLASAEKSERPFLITLGSITTANIVMSVLALWLIGRARSGAAVAVSELASVGFPEFVFIVAVALAATGISALATLLMAKKFLRRLQRIDYAVIAKAVISLLIILTFFFTGFYGLLLLATCSCLGIATNLSGIKRGTLMGVLILPTILFYAAL